MNCSLLLPRERWWPQGITGEELAALAHAAESAGFRACGSTDHPFPNVREVAGAHHTHELLTLLTYVASVTTKLKVHSHVLVAPLRNPYVVANSIATLCELVGDRVILGVGPGYLPSEFVAMRADLEDRGSVTADWIEAFDAAWRNEDGYSGGERFPAQGNTLRSHALRVSRPPIWVGGNSLASIERAVRLGDGWCPFVDVTRSAGLGTAYIDCLDELGRRIDVLRSRLADADRSGPFDICVGDGGSWPLGPVDAVLERLAHLDALGVTWVALHLDDDDVDTDGLVDRIHAFGHVLHQLAA